MEQLSREGEGVPVREAARELGTTYPRILMLIREGVLQGNREGEDWLVTRESIASFRQAGGAGARVVTCRASCGGGSCGNHG